MTVALVIMVALAAGLASSLLAPRWPRVATGIGMLGAAACLGLAVVQGADEAVAIGGVGLASSGELRLVVFGWSATALLLGVAGATTGAATFTSGPGLVALGGTSLALAVDDAGLAFAALGTGGIAAVVVPALGGWLADRETVPPTAIALRSATAIAGPAAIGLLLVAWARSPVGPLGASRVTGDGAVDPGFMIGLLLLALAATVAVRTGAIPAHLWVARLIGAVSPLAVPAVLAWGSAAFTLVALGWARSVAAQTAFTLDDLGRLLVLLVAVSSIALGGLAAILHDDLEHVLGYSIVQDAGVALLAFVSLRPEAAAAARDWLIASATLKSALAGWIAVTRWAFGVHRVSELRGWARRSPGLAATSVVVLIGTIGLPGTAIFDARLTLATSALPGALGYGVAILALSPIVAIGRILAAGVERPTPEVGGAPRDRVGVLVLPTGGWSRGGLSPGGVAWALRTARTVVGENAALLAVAATALLAALGLVLAIVGTGGAGGTTAPAA